MSSTTCNVVEGKPVGQNLRNPVSSFSASKFANKTQVEVGGCAKTFG